MGGSIEGALEYEALVTESPEDPVEVAVGMDDLCLLRTSGTTGSAEVHADPRQSDLERHQLPDLRRLPWRRRHAGNRPFFRVGGTGVNVLPVLFLGGTVVVPGDLAPEEILRAMERHRVTVGFGNPDLLDALAHSEAWPAADLSSVLVITGGAPVPNSSSAPGWTAA